MKIIVLTNKHKFPYHIQITKALNDIISANIFSAQTIDISPQTSRSDVTQQLSSAPPDLIITLDLTGFELRTLTGECLLNMLPCKVCNIIWGENAEYSNYLSGKLSLSMLFYDATGIDNRLPSQYPNMRYYYPTAKAIPILSLDKVNGESETLESLQNIWNHFMKEALL